MTTVLQRVFRLEPGEGLKVLQFAGVGLLLQAGLALGLSAADSLFLSRVGADKLPHIYLLQPVMMLLYIPAFSALLGRHGINRVFDCTLATLAAGGAVLWAMFRLYEPLPLWLCYVAKLYASLWYVGLYTLFWSFLDGYFDLLDAKRLYALFAAGCAAGSMVGGGLVSTFAESLGVETLFLGWSGCAVLCWPLVRHTRGRWKTLEAAEPEVGEAPPGAGAAALVGARSLLRSRYAIVLSAGLFLILATGTLLDYQYMSIFSAGRSEEQLAALLGRLTATVNALNMVLTLFVFNFLVSRLGVRQVALLQPLAFGAVFLWLLGDPGLPAAIAGFFAYYGLMTAIDFNNVNLLFSGLPADSRKEIRTLIEGLCEPMAMAAAGFFLLLVAPYLGLTELSQAGVVCALAALGFMLVVRQDYLAAIGRNLRRDWLDLSRRAAWSAEPVHTTEPITTEVLVSSLRTLPPGRRGGVFTMLAERAEPVVVPAVLLAAGDFLPAERRRAQQCLVAMGDAVVPHLLQAAASPLYSARARSIALRSLGEIDIRLLQKVAGGLMQRTVAKAYDYLDRYAALAAGGLQEPGRAVLARIYSDCPALAVEVVLEALTISGRLPPYEGIMVALHGGRSKERGYALETVEQAAGRKLYVRLSPWLENLAPAEKLARARVQGLLPGRDAYEVIGTSLDSAFPLEAAAAWQAYWAQGYHERLDAKLRYHPPPLLQETARILRARAKGGRAELTPVERVHALMGAAELAIFDFTHLEWLALQVSEVSPAEGVVLVRSGELLPGSWLVLAGSLLAGEPGEPRNFGVGEVAAAEALCGVPVSARTLVAGAGLRAIFLARKAVLDCAGLFPSLGLELLRRRALR